MNGKDKNDVSTFAEIMLNSVKYAYDAIANPIEVP